MKAEVKTINNEIFEIDLIAENSIEEDAIQRLWKGGMKISGISDSRRIHLAFRDLIDK